MGFFGKLFGGGSNLGDLELRVIERQLEDVTAQVIECRGLLPVYSRKNIGLVTSILCDNDEGELAPVISMLDFCQEEGTSAYQSIYEIGQVEGPGGYEDWASIAMFYPEMLQPSMGGKQTLYAFVRLVDMNDMPSITLGFSARSESIWTGQVAHPHHFENKGYKEEQEDIDEARALSIHLGVAVALVDDDFDDREGETLNKWIKNIISPFSNDKKEELKKLYNKALKDSYQLDKSGKLNIEKICKKMNKIADAAQKHEALELVNMVMAADTKILESETKLINRISSLLEIDPAESEKIRDKQLVNLKPTSGAVNVESLLGIDPTWSNSKIITHLAKEYTKWNGRMNSLSEGEEKDNAQQMLDLIGETRKKYV
jgi:uncharacterized tellurite resistance protein B-like protein